MNVQNHLLNYVDEQLDPVAYHEAGHAVMGKLLGWPVGEVWIRADGSGWCGGPGRPVDPGDQLLFTLAGPVAEAEYCGGLERLNWRRSRFGDFDVARRLLDEYEWGLVPKGERHEATLRRYAFHARDLLRPHGKKICRLADQLLARKGNRLSARAVAKLLRDLDA